MGLVHVGAHTNTTDRTLGEKVHHRTAFRRSVDEGLLDCKRVVQIGIRGSSVTLDPYRYSRSQVMDWVFFFLPQNVFSIVKEGFHSGLTRVQEVGLGLDVATQAHDPNLQGSRIQHCPQLRTEFPASPGYVRPPLRTETNTGWHDGSSGKGACP